MLPAKLGIAHARGVFLKVGSLDGDDFGSGGIQGSEVSDQRFDTAAVQLGLMTQDPSALSSLVQRIETAGNIAKVLAGMIGVDDLDRVRKMLTGDVPDPFGAVAQNDLGEGTAPASIPGFQIQALAELGGGFNGSGVGSGVRMPPRTSIGAIRIGTKCSPGSWVWWWI